MEAWTRSFICRAEEAGFRNIFLSLPIFPSLYWYVTFSTSTRHKKYTLFCTFLPFPLRILYVWKWWYWWMKAKGVHSTATAFLSVCLQMFGWAQKTGHMSNTNTVTENDLTKCFRDHNTSDLIATYWCQSLEIKEQGFPPTPLFSTDKQWQWEQYILEEDVKFPGDSSLYRLQFSAARRRKKNSWHPFTLYLLLLKNRHLNESSEAAEKNPGKRRKMLNTEWVNKARQKKVITNEKTCSCSPSFTSDSLPVTKSPVLL